MRIESIRINNFRCIGETTTITFQKDITTFIGTNGTGKTAVMYALQRLFGVSEEQRRIRLQDFHVPNNETSPPSARNLFIEAIIVFPELSESDNSQIKQSIPHLWQQLSINDNGKVKCRLRLNAKWQDDGSLDGDIETNLYGIRSLDEEPNEKNQIGLKSSERSAIQMIYIPANRDGVTQVTQLLKSRLWKAIKWQEEMKKEVINHGVAINKVFSDSQIVSVITGKIQTEWSVLHSGGTYSKPLLQPVETKFEDLI
ncbi:TPA: AAA family ATPase, partial [Yersinia enterocolitica]|nr:AAA family ATPase [Yersinia enterocolitica]